MDVQLWDWLGQRPVAIRAMQSGVSLAARVHVAVETVVLGAQCVTVFGADAGGDGKGRAFLPAAFSRPVSRCPLPPRLGAAS